MTEMGTDEPKVVEAEAPVVVKATLPANPELEKTKTVAAIDETALKTQGQRRINVVWEFTQSYLAVVVITPMALTQVYLAIALGKPEALNALENMGFAIIGFYFSRLNHDKTGGVGSKTGESRKGASTP